MGELAAVLPLLKAGWTPGGVGIFIIIAMLGGMWWKGLPALLDAWTRRADQEAQRISKDFERLERQIEAGDKRHEECLEGQRVLRGEVDRLNKVIDGLIRQMRQLQISAVRVGMDEPPTVTSKIIAELDRFPSTELGGN